MRADVDSLQVLDVTAAPSLLLSYNADLLFNILHSSLLV